MRKVSKKQLQRKTWEAFSQYIRRKYADRVGNVSCITCNKTLPWKEAHAGHFRHGKAMYTWINEFNVHPQCAGCNTYRDGARDIYATVLVRKYGPTILDELDKLYHQSPAYTPTSWLQEKLHEYQEKLAHL